RQRALDIGHPGVKYRIETRDLPQSRKVLLCNSNDRQGGRIVQWSEDGGRFDLPQHGIVDETMTAKSWPTVHHAMTYRCRPNVLPPLQERSNACERILLVS